MIFHDVVQNTPQWDRLRLGVATASSFGKIITAKTMRLSKQAESYADHLIAEMILGVPLDKFPQNYWMEQGSISEPDARAMYEFETGYETDNGGFITTDDGLFGCSLDVRVLDKGQLIGGAEIKCPAPWTHVGNLLADEVDGDYMAQINAQILIAELQFQDFVSYNRGIMPIIKRTPRDEAICGAYTNAMAVFANMMRSRITRLIEMGQDFCMSDMAEKWVNHQREVEDDNAPGDERANQPAKAGDRGAHRREQTTARRVKPADKLDRLFEAIADSN
jgi:hypothetical protein